MQALGLNKQIAVSNRPEQEKEKIRVLQGILIHPDHDSLNRYILQCVKDMYVMAKHDRRVAIPASVVQLMSTALWLDNLYYKIYALLLMILYLPNFKDFVTVYENPGIMDKFMSRLTAEFDALILGRKVDQTVYTDQDIHLCHICVMVSRMQFIYSLL